MSETALIILIGAVLGIALFYYLSNLWRGWVVRRRMARGIRMEAKGEELLRRAGYELSGVQEEMVATLYVNGEPHRYKIRPDALARKGGIDYAVEIKSGSVAPNPLFKETRRQMLEYYFYFPVEGVLLVDAEIGTITLIEFDRDTAVRSSFNLSKVIFLLLLIGAIVFLMYSKGII